MYLVSYSVMALEFIKTDPGLSSLQTNTNCILILSHDPWTYIKIITNLAISLSDFLPSGTCMNENLGLN